MAAPITDPDSLLINLLSFFPFSNIMTSVPPYAAKTGLMGLILKLCRLVETWPGLSPSSSSGHFSLFLLRKNIFTLSKRRYFS